MFKSRDHCSSRSFRKLDISESVHKRAYAFNPNIHDLGVLDAGWGLLRPSYTAWSTHLYYCSLLESCALAQEGDCLLAVEYHVTTDGNI